MQQMIVLVWDSLSWTQLSSQWLAGQSQEPLSLELYCD